MSRTDLLRAHHPDLPAVLDDLGHDELRAIASGWLARPGDVCELLRIGVDELSPGGHTAAPWSTSTSTRAP